MFTRNRTFMALFVAGFFSTGSVFGADSTSVPTPLPMPTLAGYYRLNSPCEFRAQFLGDISIPSGTIRVTENVPMAADQLEHPSISPAIIFQANGNVQSSLTLKVGRVTRFAFGSSLVTVGNYNSLGFDEVLHSDGSPDAANLIQIRKFADKLAIIATDSGGGVLANCSLHEF